MKVQLGLLCVMMISLIQEAGGEPVEYIAECDPFASVWFVCCDMQDRHEWVCQKGYGKAHQESHFKDGDAARDNDKPCSTGHPVPPGNCDHIPQPPRTTNQCLIKNDCKLLGKAPDAVPVNVPQTHKEIYQMMEDKERAKNDVEDCDSRNVALQVELDSSKKEVKELTQAKEHVGGDPSTLEQQMGDLRKEKEECDRRLQESQQKLDEAESEAAEKDHKDKETVQELTAKLEAATQSAKKLEEELTNSQTALREAKEKFGSELAEMQEVHVKALGEATAAKQESEQKMKEQVATLQTQLQTAESDVQKDRPMTKAEIEKLQEALNRSPF